MHKLFILFILSIILLSCRPSHPDDEPRAVFRYNESSNITSLDPAYAKDQANIWPCHQIFNGLLQLDENLNVVPCIASSWELDSSGKHYLFHLRQDVFFHDHPLFPEGKGRRVNAHDFVYSFNRILDPSIASPGAWVFNKVDVLDGKYAFHATDDSTLTITLREPFPPFPGILTMLYCSVVPEEIISQTGANFRKNPVGTGPFRFKMWKEGVKMVLVKNDNYFEYDGECKLPYLDAIAITFLADKQAAFLEFVKGNLDFISGLDQSYKDELLTRDGNLRPKYKQRFDLITQPYLNTEYLGILVDTTLQIVRESPLRHKQIRQAINYGFDRVKMIRYLRNNIGYPGMGSIIPPGLSAFDSSFSAYGYDPDKARALIREAGYDKSDSIPEIILHTTSEYVDLFKFIQNQLAEIGLRVRIEVNPAATLMEMKARSKINFFRASWIADYPDEENYLSLFYSKNLAPTGPNYSRFKNHSYDSLYEASQNIISKEQRLSYYEEMNRMIARESPVIILYYDQVLRFTQKNILDIGSNPLNLLSLKRVRKSLSADGKN